MAKEVVMPKLAMGMNEGKITGWKFKTGDLVEKGVILLVIETEKVSYEMESPGTGYLKITVEEGQTVKIETVIGLLAESKEELASLDGGKPASVPISDSPGQAAPAQATQGLKGGRIVASPLAKRLAEQNGIDLATVAGSGPGGRIEKRDVEVAIENKSAKHAATQPPAAATEPSAAPAKTTRTGTGLSIKTTLPVTGVRKAIADNMMKSLASAAQMSASVEVDATEIVQLRERLVAKAETLGARVTYFSILAKIVARAVQQVPIVNSSIVGDEIQVWNEVNLGVAIGTAINEYESSLFVPVIRDVAKKSLFDITREIAALTAKARAGALTLEDMSGGTLTLSSAAFTGGLLATTPILVPGQALLIQPGLMIQKPVVRGGEIVSRWMLPISVTWDHRILDGVPIGRLFQKIADLLDCPDLLL
jgi:pyruvate dehydrogenase E2 component (dihydrolipoamide acetyltransferase)/2-oxoglutarate dehydrogenase E2 component (dihydrolipoamide succinyltransferase)